MAEETKNNPGVENQDNTPTVEQLMAELASAKADAERFKSANDKLSKEAAEAKRRERERMTEEEKKAEAERLRDEQFKEMEARLNRSEAEKAYKSIGDEKTVNELIDAVSNADHSVIAENFVKAYNKGFSDGQQEYLDSRPEVNYGGSSEVKTVKQIKAVKDTTERQRLIAENIDLF